MANKSRKEQKQNRVESIKNFIKVNNNVIVGSAIFGFLGYLGEKYLAKNNTQKILVASVSLASAFLTGKFIAERQHKVDEQK